MSFKFLWTILILISFIDFVDTAFNVTVVCKICTNPKCPYSSCYEITDDKGYTNQVCRQCSLKRNFQTVIHKCSGDVIGQFCRIEICYSSSYSQNFCGDSVLIDYCSSVSLNGSSTCGLCNNPCSNPNCVTTKIGNASTEYCFNVNCSTFTNTSYEVKLCDNHTDYYGFPCSCCLNSFNTTISLPFCIIDSIFLNDGNFVTYAHQRLTNQQHTSVDVEVGLLKGIYFLFSIVFFIFIQ